MTTGEYQRYRNTSLAHIRMLRNFIDKRRYGHYSAQNALKRARESLAGMRRDYYGDDAEATS